MTQSQLKLSIQEQFPLAPLTTLKVGGAARFFVRAETEEQVAGAVNFAKEYDLPLFILGGGSNILVSDQGFDGLVLQIGLKGIQVNDNLVTAQAGEDWDQFVKFCVEKNLQGIECLSGIPGFVGGTPVQNVGAYGQEVSETITSVIVFDLKSAQILELSNKECKFSYRSSIFNTTDKNRFIVLAVTFALKQNGEPKIVYKDLRQVFGDKTPSLQETREAVCRVRAEKAMLVRQSGTDSNSAGSFFKNPVVSNENFIEIAERAKTIGFKEVPHFTVDEKSVKIPAAWLIEKSGFYKGYIKNNAGLSSKHTLALINRGGATTKDILALKDEIQAQVKKVFGVELTPEPIFVGVISRTVFSDSSK